MHLAPRCDSHAMDDSNVAATFGYIARELDRHGLAFVISRERQAPDSIDFDLRRAFGGVCISNEGFRQASAEQILADDGADAVAFGKMFIGNPDLIRRFAEDATLNVPVPRDLLC